MAPHSTSSKKGHKDRGKRKALELDDLHFRMPSNKKPKTTSNAKSTTTSSSKPPSDKPRVPQLASIHEGMLANLKTKYDVLPIFIISSNKISKRVTYILQHLHKDNGDPRRRVVLLHARPSEVCKMITIAEQVKRILSQNTAEQANDSWFQYNMMFEAPAPKPSSPDLVNETILGNDNEDGEPDTDDFFEVDSRLQQAIAPQPIEETPFTLSIFLAASSVPELKARADVTVQASTDHMSSV